MALTKKLYLVIDAGGTYLKSAVLDWSGEVIANSGFTTKSHSKGTKEEILQAFGEIVLRGLKTIEENEAELGGIGIAIPGPFDYKNCIPLMEHKFMSIYGVNMENAIQKFTGLSPDLPIRFMHDANAVLAGELWKGNAQGFDNTAVVTIGTGLGFACTQKKIIQLNELGGPGTTIYRLPCRQGILEDFVSKRGFIQIYRDLSEDKDSEKIKVSDIGNWANEGNSVSIQTFTEVAGILAAAIEKILIDRNIQCLLLGGQISRSFHHMENTLKQGLKDVKSLERISDVQSIDNAALFGALQNLLQNP